MDDSQLPNSTELRRSWGLYRDMARSPFVNPARRRATLWALDEVERRMGSDWLERTGTVPGTCPPRQAGRVSLERRSQATPPPRGVGQNVQSTAWRWAQANRADDGSLPSGRAIAGHYGRHERWRRMVKRSSLAGEIGM